MNRGKVQNPGSASEEREESRGSGVKVKSRGPGISSLKNRIPPIVGNNNSSVSGAGYNSQLPYKGPVAASLNTNVFNIPKYGSGSGLGGGIGGGIGSYGSGLGGGIGGGIGGGMGGGIGGSNNNYGGYGASGSGIGSALSREPEEGNNFGGRYKF